MVLRARCECTVVVRAGEVPSLPDLRALLRERFGEQAERGKLRYSRALRCARRGGSSPFPEDTDLLLVSWECLTGVKAEVQQRGEHAAALAGLTLPRLLVWSAPWAPWALEAQGICPRKLGRGQEMGEPKGKLWVQLLCVGFSPALLSLRDTLRSMQSRLAVGLG